MKILTSTITAVFLSASAYLCADIVPGDPDWPTSYPDWWYNASDPANGVIDATMPALNQNNNAILNQGQLWNITNQAIQELDAQLALVGGAGFSLSDWSNGLSPDYYAPANLGQLKNVSSRFYDIFEKIGYDSTQPGWPTGMILDPVTGYPWGVNVTPENLSPSNLGQAKHLFSWDLATYMLVDTDGAIPDWWEHYYTGGTSELGASPADKDGDGVGDLDEYTAGSDPVDFYNGEIQNYQISVVNTVTPSAVTGVLASQALQLEVRDSEGVLVENAPVYLSPSLSTAFLTIDPNGGALASDLVVRTDTSGIATVYIQP